MVHDSWLKAHGACLKAHGSRLMAKKNSALGPGWTINNQLIDDWYYVSSKNSDSRQLGRFELWFDPAILTHCSIRTGRTGGSNWPIQRATMQVATLNDAWCKSGRRHGPFVLPLPYTRHKTGLRVCEVSRKKKTRMLISVCLQINQLISMHHPCTNNGKRNDAKKSSRWKQA